MTSLRFTPTPPVLLVSSSIFGWDPETSIISWRTRLHSKFCLFFFPFYFKHSINCRVIVLLSHGVIDLYSPKWVVIDPPKTWIPVRIFINENNFSHIHMADSWKSSYVFPVVMEPPFSLSLSLFPSLFVDLHQRTVLYNIYIQYWIGYYTLHSWCFCVGHLMAPTSWHGAIHFANKYANTKSRGGCWLYSFLFV